ncbi:MAG: serine/threonine protein kinase [Elusimicrobia bacterium]|nr:serine/threonine protein kinase [Elusimicrobiota bacterium]
MIEPVDNLLGSMFAGCKIMQKLGQGGMGSVYLARHEALDKLVCVKLLSPELAREERNVEFFLREARSAAKLEHPNIVHVYNFGQENGSYFIVMSYVDGKSLADIVAEKGPLSVDAATFIIVRVMEGLSHAHSHTIIHRDIKPSNILLGMDGQPRIVDFGLARSINEEKQLTIAGEMVGTAYFMSPEQGLAAKVDHRADLYSTGATYFYLLTGRYPFEGKSAIEVIHKHISDPFPNIIVVNPNAPLWISRFLEKMMRKKPEDRYQTAVEAIEDMKRLMAARKDGTDISTERNIEIPEISARFAKEETPAAAGEPAPAPLISDRSMAESFKRHPPAPAPSPVKPILAAPANLKLQMPRLYNSVKAAIHFCITFAALGCFLLAGAAGKPGADPAASLSSPLALSPVSAAIALAAGLALIIWAIAMKPRKFTGLHAFFMLAVALSAYAGGIYVPAPETPDMVSKAFFCFSTALQNMFSSSNILIYALFLYLAASKLAFIDHWAAKTGAALIYALSLFLAYSHFKSGLDIVPDKASMLLTGACALAGFGAVFTQKQFAVFFNPVLFFLAAHALLAVMFAAPQIAVITENKIKEETVRVERLNKEANAKYQAGLIAFRDAVPEYDLEGRPVEKRPPAPPEKAQPAGPGAFNQAARAEYYKSLASNLANNLLNTAGLVFIALFLCLMANISFVEEAFFAGEKDVDFIGYKARDGGLQ